VTPNMGVTYSGSTSMIGDHGGFAHDDNNVIMLVANPSFEGQTVSSTTTTTQVAPTIVQALGLNPSLLNAVQIEGTAVLPEVIGNLASSRSLKVRREKRGAALAPLFSFRQSFSGITKGGYAAHPFRL